MLLKKISNEKRKKKPFFIQTTVGTCIKNYNTIKKNPLFVV